MQADNAERIRRLLATQNGNIRRAFERMLAQINSDLPLDDIVDLLERGLITTAFERMQGAISAFGTATNAAFIASSSAIAADITERIAGTVAFDVTNQRAVGIMRDKRLELIRNFTVEQERAVRQALARGIAEGLNPKAQARLFRSAIGLTVKQESAVATFRRLLETGSAEALQRALRDKRFDRTVQRAIRGEPLTTAQIDRMTMRYRERFLIFRSETIARTEALRAVHEASEEMFRQAIDGGSLDADSLTRTWITARDNLVRHFTNSSTSHRTMNGQQRKFGEPFISGAGNRLRFPGDPQAPSSETVRCRCIVTTRISDAASN